MFIGSHIDGLNTVEKLVELLKGAIIDDVPEEILYDDVTEFIDTLAAKLFVEA